jgi:Ca2+-binding EF-hand superfamily protein
VLGIKAGFRCKGGPCCWEGIGKALAPVGTDPEDVIRNAFACFDEENTGKINEDRLRELLTTMGDRFTDAEV